VSTTVFPVVSRQPSGGQASKVVATLLIVVGALTASAAIALIILFGTAGRLDSGSHQVASSASAIVTDISKIQDTNEVVAVTGWPVVAASASGGNTSGVFIGIGRSRDVERFLAGVAFDRVTDIEFRPFELDLSRVPGSTESTPPGAETFWVASSKSTTDAQLSWRIADGDYRMVIMNADGAPGVITAARVQLLLPNAFPLSLAVLGVGLVVTSAGIVIAVLATTRGRRRPVPIR
jgi:hypothetical protein